MTTVQFQAVEVPGKGWSMRIPGVVDRLRIDGREVWRERRNAETAARLWLKAVKATANRAAWDPQVDSIEAWKETAVTAVAEKHMSCALMQTRALLEACNWFADEPEEDAPVDGDADDAAPEADVYVEALGDQPWEGRFVAFMELDETGTTERWIDPEDVQGLIDDLGVTVIAVADQRDLRVRGSIAEVAEALGLRARDCRHVGAKITGKRARGWVIDDPAGEE